MTYSTFSSHAPTGANSNAKVIVSPNEYAPEGRSVTFPTRLSLYVNRQSNIDGSMSVTESHTASQIIGNRLYLYHRPLVDSNGTVTSISSSAGTIISANTNAKQGYIEFSVVPTSDFTVSYNAAPDCVTAWSINVLQDDVMEIQRTIGPTNQTGWAGMRHAGFAVFNSPSDNINTVLTNAQYLSYVNTDIRISSSEDSLYYPSRGSGHNIQIGSRYDRTLIEGSGIILAADVDSTNPSASLFANIHIGNNTGDQIFYKGRMSGEGQLTVGGALHTGYSGSFGAVSGSFYTGAMVRVNGNLAVLGNQQINGTLTVVHTTGETSTVLGDFTVRDELFVYGKTHLNGPTETNAVRAYRDITYEANLVAGNSAGSAEHGHSAVDGLDASEVAASYKWVTKKGLSNYIVSAPKYNISYLPKRSAWTSNQFISGDAMVGDEFVYSGNLNAAASSSGAHQSILQLLCTGTPFPFISGHYTGGIGTGNSGWFSRGLMDPGSLWIDLPTIGYSAPIYGHTVEELTGENTAIGRLNVFTPTAPVASTAGNIPYCIYVPGCRHYDFILNAGGEPTTPNIQISASTSDPLVLSIDNQIRILSTNSATLSLVTALNYAVSGLSYATPTGTVYVIASKNVNTDPEVAPAFLTRATPFTMPGELTIGEVTAVNTGVDLWSIKEITSYRPGAYYDSSWIPIVTGVYIPAGRLTPKINYGTSNSTTRLYFNHNLGAGISPINSDFKLYLGAFGVTGVDGIWPNQYHGYTRSLFGHDARRGIGLSGAFTCVDLNNRGSSSSPTNDASIFYIDGKVIGINLNQSILDTTQSGIATFNYLRLVGKRTE